MQRLESERERGGEWRCGKGWEEGERERKKNTHDSPHISEFWLHDFVAARNFRQKDKNTNATLRRVVYKNRVDESFYRNN